MQCADDAAAWVLQLLDLEDQRTTLLDTGNFLNDLRMDVNVLVALKFVRGGFSWEPKRACIFRRGRFNEA